MWTCAFRARETCVFSCFIEAPFINWMFCQFLTLLEITVFIICVSMYSGTIVKKTPPATFFLRWIGPEIWTYHDSSPLKFHDTLANLIHRRSQIQMHVHFEQRHEQSHKHGSTQICEHILYGSCTYKIRARQLINWCRSAQQHARWQAVRRYPFPNRSTQVSELERICLQHEFATGKWWKQHTFGFMSP